MEYVIFKPEVNDIEILKEIAQNLVNPLEMIREALSNSSDANGKNIQVKFYRNDCGEFCITIKDDGDGMDVNNINKFFNLGTSNKIKMNIGEKGLGTTIYYRSEKILVKTKQKEGKYYEAIMKNPWSNLQKGDIPTYTIKEIETNKEYESGTEVTIVGYKIDNPERIFSYDTVKDYIQWFTVGGSFKNYFSEYLSLRNIVNGIDCILNIELWNEVENRREVLSGVHKFHLPNEYESRLGKIEKVDSDNYCRHFGPFYSETNISGRYVSVQIYGTVSGVNCRKAISKLKKGETYKNRFGLYLCKDFIPVVRRADLLKDEQYYHYHILVNSQNFMLTSDRNNITNIDSPEVKWILNETKKIIDTKIKPIAEKEYFSFRKVEEDIKRKKNKYVSIEKFKNQVKFSKNLKVNILGIEKEPLLESEVCLLLSSLLGNKESKEFMMPLDKIVSYSTKMCVDMICKDVNSNYKLVEVEYLLSSLFRHDHPIEQIDFVVCWEMDLELNTEIQIGNNIVIIKKFEDKFKMLWNYEKQIEIICLRTVIERISNKNKEKVG